MKERYLPLDRIVSELRKKEPPAEDPEERFAQLRDLLSTRLLDAAAEAGHPSCATGPWCFKRCTVCHPFLNEKDWQLFEETLNLYREIASPEERKEYL